VRLIVEEGCGNLFGEKDPNSGLKIGFSTMTMLLCIMLKELAEFLAKKSITKMDHPPYSPDLAPCDFRLFPEFKNVLTSNAT
jgi:hypothetical protein